mmetsp:Transcript_3311/g.4555  ORF Transcript_3311/g.4555 Transcript_3311/m.4555 type:complete len:137 (-) Transcript_3311:111-521(-)|eukprot:CAMPEP_0168559460 /NCGR_PEP_ID=MMETSP0413-20121227/10537_1 /TAXON_ID=136452 /ORGANISM="Filamoeba nolandi, Strain NC-AS-23-1" /LENGTH=136 /DNA_ID=CAMNT_0008590693 /DNA_START=38 /DNA_END=448 /DNA_ORIENTATION=+
MATFLLNTLKRLATPTKLNSTTLRYTQRRLASTSHGSTSSEATLGGEKGGPLMSEIDSLTHHEAESAEFYRLGRAPFVIGCGAALVAIGMEVVFPEHEHQENAGYPYRDRLRKKFAWGSGNDSLFTHMFGEPGKQH